VTKAKSKVLDQEEKEPAKLTVKVKFLKPVGGFGYHTNDVGIVKLTKERIAELVNTQSIEIVK